MPTQSEIRNPKPETRSGEWAARTDTPKRSVFGNYRAANSGATGHASAPLDQNQLTSAAANDAPTLQASVDFALARSFIHRFLAKAYEDPTPDGWAWLCSPDTQQCLKSAWNIALAR
jgi:hypothetical protein